MSVRVQLIIVGLIVAAAVGYAVVALIRRHRRGSNGCSCGCDSCTLSDCKDRNRKWL